MNQEKTEIRREELVEGQLTKIVYKDGEGDLPANGQEIFALYRGTLENGSQFDSNQNREDPFKFTLGQGMVIKGWDIGFASMRRGEQAKLICSPQYAYGARGSPPRIPANSTLHFEVELIDFQDKKKEKWEMDTAQKVEIATNSKKQGNDLLMENQFQAAISKYSDGISYVEDDDDEAAKAILKTLRMNLSQACIKAKRFVEAIENCTKVLKVDEKNIKTLYRRAVAYLGNQQFEQAQKDANQILQLDPNNEQAKLELTKILAQKKAAQQKQKKLFGSMFSKSGLYDDKKPKEKKSKPDPKEEQSDNEQMPSLEKDEEEEKKGEGQEDGKQVNEMKAN